MKQALLCARGRGGGTALTARDALRLGTRGGAEILCRPDLGSLEPGRCADLAVWRLDRLEFAGADDPVAGLVLAGPLRVDRLYVGGEEVVRDGRLVRADEAEIAKEQRPTGGEVRRMSASLSTHVLDLGRGAPAAGILIELLRDGDLVASSETDEDGRVGDLGGTLETGTYQLGCSIRPPPSSGASSSSSSSRTAIITTSPSSSLRFGCASYRGS